MYSDNKWISLDLKRRKIFLFAFGNEISGNIEKKTITNVQNAGNLIEYLKT